MALTKAAKHVPISLLVAQTLQGEADAALGEAEAMSLRPLATLEELDGGETEKTKTTKKDIRSYSY